MPISTVSPTRAILCAGSDASLLKVSRTPYRSTVNRVFDERTCTRMREQPCLTLSKTTARRNLLVSSAVSRSSRSALRKPRSIAILYCIASGAPVWLPSSPSTPFGPLGFGPSAKTAAHDVLFVDDVHCPPQSGRAARCRDSPARRQPSWILIHDPRCKTRGNPGLIGPSSSAASRSGKTRVNVVERFAGFAEGYRGQPVAPQVLHQAKRAVIDWYAALLPGGVVPPALLLERALAGELDHGEARLALGRRAGVRSAALINGAAAHTVEVDDIFREGIYHPGAPTIAAALAVAQSRRASGEQFLRAVIVGYEISTRIAAAMGRAHYRYWHNTGTIGCFGAASAAAELLGLDRRRFAHALATVATFSAGLQQAFRADSMSKPMHAGRAAEAGVTAALAAAEGLTGSLDIMEGGAGFGP